MKQRPESDWNLNAYELARQHGAPGDVAFAVKCLKFGYGLGVKDSTDALREANDRIAKIKERSNAPT